MIDIFTKEIFIVTPKPIGIIRSNLFFGKLGAIGNKLGVTFMDVKPADGKPIGSIHTKMSITLVSRDVSKIDELLKHPMWKSNKDIILEVNSSTL